ncbi:LruC domain-containing protein [Fulvivirgaceae bacterium BMA10]|uniref:LruC domain-containing protein n=1 Tax=Splendidivirga corallicola TaxID=3051826 RepID=A0ABT8KHJ3_9BACT|nr:LruC domain-containing protein [Fulvivirgaceae bacterium BMA10]
MQLKVRDIVFLLAAICILSWSSCVKDRSIGKPTPSGEGLDGLIISDNFNYETTNETAINISVVLNEEPLIGIPLEIYNDAPPSLYNDDPDEGGQLLASGTTNANGAFQTSIQMASHHNEIFVKTNFLGVPNLIMASIVNGMVELEINDALLESVEDNTAPNFSETARFLRTYAFLGNFNKKGVPAYLENERDEIQQDLLDDINASLPEREPVPEAHPEYIAQGAETDLRLNAQTDIWVTFVHEGAGYKNVLGFYTYDVASPPQSADDIEELIVIFPNVSFKGSGGGLRSGDKVKIGRFDAGTGIGWFIVANGYKGNRIGDGKNIFYSNPDFNPESSESLRQHNVLLRDNGRNLILLGFEDLKRDVNSDEDFNDAVFYITASQYEAIEVDNFEQVTSTQLDTDGDNIADAFDNYPNDANKAFDNYYPGENIFGTLAFEDLWPNKGDYDFNDLVVDYNYNQITNAANQIVEVQARFIVKAIGASFRNGFGFQMNLPSSDVSSVTGMSIEDDYITLNANGTEAGQTKATVIAIDNAFDILPHPGGQQFVNTEPEGSYVTPDTVKITVVLNSPRSLSVAGLAPYNPFMIINQERGKEVHLPGYQPTSLADNSYFGLGIDDTNMASAKFYKSDGNLPWGLNLPENFDYPSERVEITQAHLTFSEWVQSDGFSRQDWYRNLLGHRKADKIYRKPQ